MPKSKTTSARGAAGAERKKKLEPAPKKSAPTAKKSPPTAPPKSPPLAKQRPTAKKAEPTAAATPLPTAAERAQAKRDLALTVDVKRRMVGLGVRRVRVTIDGDEIHIFLDRKHAKKLAAGA
ncbi:MAG: hypothetical protein U1F43_14060 [Myxococcota bacterium]